jgi:hypothetical protein
MNSELFENLILSYGFNSKKLPEDMQGLFKYYELKFESEDKKTTVDMSLYWYNDDTFSLYRKEGFAAVKVCDDKMNIYNIKLNIEKHLPNKYLKELD